MELYALHNQRGHPIGRFLSIGYEPGLASASPCNSTHRPLDHGAQGAERQ